MGPLAHQLVRWFHRAKPLRTWARVRSKRGRSVRAWRGGWQRTWCRRRPGGWGAWPWLVTPSNSHRINTPALTGPSVIASQSPPEPTSCRCLNGWQVHYRRDEASRVAAPRLTTGDGTTSVGANCAIVTAQHKRGGGNFLKCISAISAELEHAAVETYTGINIRCFKIEVVPE
jgi:hypothetical protein